MTGRPPFPPAEPALVLSGLFFQSDDKIRRGPVNLRFLPGQGLLVLAPAIAALQGLLTVCAGLNRPAGGQALWWGRPWPGRFWEHYENCRRIGLVHRRASLLSDLTLLENLALGLEYARQPRRAVMRRVQSVLDDFGLTPLAQARAGRLEEPERRLALYALALAKSPDLLLMERPAQFLDEHFSLVMKLVAREAAERELAFAAFDRQAYSRYDRSLFSLAETAGPSGNFSETTDVFQPISV